MMMPNMLQIMQFLQNNQNPMFQNLLKMIQSNDKNGIENLARNLMKTQGKDFDKEFTSFKQRFGLQ